MTLFFTAGLGLLLELATVGLVEVPTEPAHVLGKRTEVRQSMDDETPAGPTPTPTRALPVIVAHRGASADAPENTLAAFELSWEQQADAIEGDFFLTADQTIVAIHDRTTKRTGGENWDVRTKTLAELQTLDVGRWKAEKYAGQSIPTLPQVCQILPADKQLFLEIKDSPRLVPVLQQQLHQEPVLAALQPQQIVIIAFDPEVIAACKQQLPQHKAHWLTGFKKDRDSGIVQPTVDQVLETLRRIGADGLDCQASDHIDQDFVDQIRAGGFEFHVWTVDDPQVALRFARLGVDSITTNRPAVIRQHLQQERSATPRP